MALHKYKPTSPGTRFRVTTKRNGLHKGDPYAPLTEGKKASSGRGSNGRITGAAYRRRT